MADFLNSLILIYSQFVKGWAELEWNSLKFGRIQEVFVFVLALGAVLFAALTFHFLSRKKIGRRQIVMPAVIPSFKRSRPSFVRHLPLLLFFLGLPLFFIALADPYASFIREETTYPGRRIAILVDASSSMNSVFESSRLKTAVNYRFFTAVAAAKHFVETRMKNKNKDLMALIEFGNESYIVTPFTTDYRNILTSISLISEPEERARFTDGGTEIEKAIEQGVELFRSFDFLDSSGNLIVLISDGEDTVVYAGQLKRSWDHIVEDARQTKIPIYMIRTVLNAPDGTEMHQESTGVTVNMGLYDKVWKPVIEKTGGKFYAAPDENAIFEAITDIDKSAVGKVELTRYSSKKPLFGLFLTAACLIWGLGLVLNASFRTFRKFP